MWFSFFTRYALNSQYNNKKPDIFSPLLPSSVPVNFQVSVKQEEEDDDESSSDPAGAVVYSN